MANDELGTGVKGKVGELLVCGELLKRHLEVFVPQVDSGVDCLVRVGEGNYKEIQIKYCEGQPAIFQARRFKARANFYFACHHGRWKETWIIPSQVFADKGTIVRDKKSRESIRLTIGEEGTGSYEALRQYRDNFALLKLAAMGNHEPKRPLAQRRRALGKHLTQPEFGHEVLAILSREKRPMATGNLLARLERNLRNRFGKSDLQPVKSGRLRWDSTARFAIYQGLQARRLISRPDGLRSQWVITAKGRNELQSR